MICDKCGKENPENVKFCNNCGAKLVNNTPHEQSNIKKNKNINTNMKIPVWMVILTTFLATIVILGLVFVGFKLIDWPEKEVEVVTQTTPTPIIKTKPPKTPTPIPTPSPSPTPIIPTPQHQIEGSNEKVYDAYFGAYDPKKDWDNPEVFMIKLCSKSWEFFKTEKTGVNYIGNNDQVGAEGKIIVTFNMDRTMDINIMDIETKEVLSDNDFSFYFNEESNTAIINLEDEDINGEIYSVIRIFYIDTQGNLRENIFKTKKDENDWQPIPNVNVYKQVKTQEDIEAFNTLWHSEHIPKIDWGSEEELLSALQQEWIYIENVDTIIELPGTDYEDVSRGGKVILNFDPDDIMTITSYVNQTDEIQGSYTYEYNIVNAEFAYVEHWSYMFQEEYYSFRVYYYIDTNGYLLETYWISKIGENDFHLISDCNVYMNLSGS